MIQVDKNEMLQAIMAAEYKRRNKLIRAFIPSDPKAKPFEKQLEYFTSKHLFNLVRCGNRAGKTFSTMRNLAWVIMRSHPYKEQWNIPSWNELDYEKTGGKIFWCVGPSYDFVNDTMWEMYLKKFIPEWFYTDDKGKKMIQMNPRGNIDCITFRNGDRLDFRAYTQDLLTMMGAAIHGCVVDEMPSHLKILSELATRTLDNDGFFDMGFTPLNPVPEIKAFLDTNPEIHTFCWGVQHNPKFRDNPEKLRRALSMWDHLPENERKSRIHGEWYYDLKGGFVFEGLEIDVIEDFPVPFHWRRIRIADPASHITGFAQFAENPVTGEWVCYDATEFKWKKSLASVSDIIKHIEDRKPAPDYKYYMSKYDNASGFFGAEAHAVGFLPCIAKNRDQAIAVTKEVIASSRLKFFKHAAMGAITQIRGYKFKDDGKVYKRYDNMLDCVMYFCREIPPLVRNPLEDVPEHLMLATMHRKKLTEPKKKVEKMYPGFKFNPKKFTSVQKRGTR